MSYETKDVYCYSIVLAAQSIEAKDNSISLLNLVEGLDVQDALFGQAVPFNLVSAWIIAPHLLDGKFEAQSVAQRIGDDVQWIDDVVANVIATNGEGTPPSGRIRVRLQSNGWRIPKEPGEYKIHMRWRLDGESEWKLSESFWYVIVRSFAGPVADAQIQVQVAP